MAINLLISCLLGNFPQCEENTSPVKWQIGDRYPLVSFHLTDRRKQVENALKGAAERSHALFVGDLRPFGVGLFGGDWHGCCTTY